MIARIADPRDLPAEARRDVLDAERVRLDGLLQVGLELRRLVAS